MTINLAHLTVGGLLGISGLGLLATSAPAQVMADATEPSPEPVPSVIPRAEPAVPVMAQFAPHSRLQAQPEVTEPDIISSPPPTIPPLSGPAATSQAAPAQTLVSPPPATLAQEPSQDLDLDDEAGEEYEVDEAEQIRQELRVDPLAEVSSDQIAYPPSPSAGIPSAFGADWGDFFVSAALSSGDDIRPDADASLSAGFGLGDARNLVGVELGFNLQSIDRFGENGSFDAKVHRELFYSDRAQMSAAVGWVNFANYGSNAAGSEDGIYGIVTGSYLLRPNAPINQMPLTATLGLGDGIFSQDSADIGVIAGLGLQVDPRLSINTAWSGVGLNIGASVVPIPTVPLTMNFLVGDVTDETDTGTVAVFTIGYGFNFGPTF